MTATPPTSGAPDASARAVLDAVVAMSSDLDLPGVLTRIVRSAAELTDARYGALGVIGRGALAEFVTTGLTDEQEQQIGPPPHGRGILGLLIDHPEPIRLRDLSQHPLATGFPPGHPPMASFLGVPVRIRGTVFGNLYLTEKAGGAEFTDDDLAVVETLANAAGFVIENARAYGLSERRRQWLEASAQLTEALQPPIDLRLALDRLARAARTVARARMVTVATRTAAGSFTSVAADPGDEEVAERTAAAVADLAAAPGTVTERTVDDLAVVAVPLGAQLAEHGLLVAVFDRAYDPAEREERELLLSFAEQAGLALDRAQAVAERAQLAIVSDRERIARDLHDVVIQRVFATGLQLQGVGLLVEDVEISRRLDAAVEALDQTIKDIRGTIFELEQRRPTSLRTELRELVRDYVPVLGFTPAVRTTGPVDTAVPAEVREQLVPVLREALSNLARHALADDAEVRLDVTGEEVCLHVTDDGVGLRPGARESGLRNARQRAAALGGSLEITAREPRGTRFSWRVPLR
ncbi:MAG TPA: GAF domain-containing protein [Nocardioides sp.]|uniref:GAF domain-containing sensor histidine kinase n=1 Tax=Nocardioides sp. TaxID=35761 RepID=UPI002ED905C2